MGRHGHVSSSPASSRRRMPPSPSSPEQHTPRRPTPEEQTSSYSHEEDRHQRSVSSRSGKKRKEKNSKSKYFHLMLQEGERSGCRPLAELKRSELLQKVPVPGQNKLADGSVAIAVEATPKLKHLLIALKNLIFCLKGQGKSLDGDFDAENLVWIPISKQIKFRKIKEQDFKRYKEQRGKKDCHSIAESLERLLHGYDLPEDLKHWLRLLKSDPYGNKYLVQNHMCLLAPIAKLQQFIYLYGELEQHLLRLKKLQDLENSLFASIGRLKKERDDCKRKVEKGFSGWEKQYQVLSAEYDAAAKEHNAVMAEMTECSEKETAILMAVRCGDTETSTTWRDRAKKNKYLLKVFDQKKDYYNSADGSIGLIDFGRNCSQHLIDHSVDERGGVRYSYLQMVTIIVYGFPALFHEFQEAMWNVGVMDPSFE